MIDSNEIGAWVSHCVNVAYLLNLRQHVESRISDLGGAPPPPPVTPPYADETLPQGIEDSSLVEDGG